MQHAGDRGEPRIERPAEGVVHVLVGSLDDAPAAGEEALSAEERERAAAMGREVVRRRFVRGRLALRAVLGAYLGRPAGEVAIAVGRTGKPRLADGGEARRLSFSLSHTGSILVVAVAAGRAVGVDAERLVPRRDPDGLARLVLSEAELAAYRALPEGERLRELLGRFALKEAALKATGEGLRVAPGAVAMDPEAAPVQSSRRVFRPRGPGLEGEAWTARAADVGPGAVGAVALAGKIAAVRYKALGEAIGPAAARDGAAEAAAMR